MPHAVRTVVHERIAALDPAVRRKRIEADPHHQIRRYAEPREAVRHGNRTRQAAVM